jgi:O-antigen/teichoic acid export membrane protein
MFSGLLGAVWTFHRVSRVVRPGFHGGLRWLRPIACYALKLAPGSVSLKLMTSVDRLVLIPYIPAGELGLYSVAYSLSRLVFVLQTAVSTVLYPRLAGRPAVEISQLYSFSFRFVFYGVAATAILLAALAHYLLRMLYGPDFAKADILLIVLAIEAGVNALGELVIQLHVAAGQPSFASNTQIFTVVTATSLLLVLVPYYGAAGAAASLLIAAVLRLTVLLSGMRMRLHMPLPGLLPRVRDVLYVRERLL